MYIMGENPAMSDPDQHHARAALAMLEHLVVQDIFLTETAWHADVVLPASAHAEKLGTYTNTNRQIQIGRPALDLPGEARQDWELIVELARRIGLDWNYGHVSEVYAEMARVMPSLKQHLLGSRRARGLGHLPGRRPRRAGQRDRLHLRLPDRRRARPHRAGRPAAARRGARRGISAGADDRPHARALAYRRHDAARRRARRDRAAGHRRHEPLRDRDAAGSRSAT